MKFTNASIQPSAGYYFVKGPFVPEQTEGGLHLPKMTGPDGKPLPSSTTESVTAEIIAVGSRHDGKPPQWGVGDRVLLSILPHGIENEGVEVAFIQHTNVLARIA